MQGPPMSPTRLLSEQVLEVAMTCDEITQYCQPRVPLPALTDADQRTLRRLYARCDGVITAAKDTQAALAPYLGSKAA